MLSLQNATYLVRDLERGIRFFVDGLGFAVRQDDVGADGSRRVVVGPVDGGAGLVLLVTDDPAVGRQAGGSVAFFLETDDFATQHARMRAHGVVFREQPRHEPYGTVAVFEDPEGMPWDLIEPPQHRHPGR